MTSNKKQSKNISNNFLYLIYLFLTPSIFFSYQSIAQESYKLNEMEINRNINLEKDDDLDFSTNPFEIVDRIRRANSMNDATKPSDAIDEAIKSFDMINVEKQI